ncbi:Cupredoxin [Glarea lozoyensis ATCC 20868]|uniref:Cupredoxin n=1 Tax=Glarea lozoyensis (strain ATCC 20868 / MF5171) TaxID=1116229 RepID=S3DS88_GLAL2|nr:Cupredoxin [Glarea lozoyensis ATCC 20868]EPE29278.1 Cupredoxin [Glarea lozoyensis ATCC 20868]
MFLFSLVAPCALLYFGLAQAEGTYSSSKPVTTTKVAVGANGHVFTPEVITAAVGDIIEFQFYPLNHSVARSDFKQPCIPYEFSGPSRSGFWSKFFPLNVIATSPPTFQVRVNDTEPIFFYCSAPDACRDGMVGVINPNATQTLDVQKKFAANASYDFSPGENFPAEESASRSSILATATATGLSQAATTTATTTATTAASAESHGHPLAIGTIAGIVIGGVALCFLVGVLIYWCGRQRTISEIIQTQNHKEDHIEKGHMSMGSPGYSAKSPVGLAHYSSHNDRYPSTMENEGRQSARPAVDEHGDLASPTRSLPAVVSNQQRSQDRQPPYSSIVANDIGHQHSPSINGSPRSEVHGGGFQPMTTDVDVPVGLRINHRPSQYGPHELAGDARIPQMMEQAPPYRYEKR